MLLYDFFEISLFYIEYKTHNLTFALFYLKDDLVFMPKENDGFNPCEESLNEYVLNDTGKVYKSAGLDRSVYPPKPVPFGKTWNFAQVC